MHAGRVGAIIAAILLPPLGVYIVHGIGPLFWISIPVTLIAFVPGTIFSLIAVLAPDLFPQRWRTSLMA